MQLNRYETKQETETTKITVGSTDLIVGMLLDSESTFILKNCDGEHNVKGFYVIN
jgi:hypothetical protein